MSRRIRFRFSLATLLIAMAWSACVVWMNAPGCVELMSTCDIIHEQFANAEAKYGWPWQWASRFELHTKPASADPGLFVITSGPALAGDVAAGVLFVIALTWASGQLLRRVGVRLRRRTEGDSTS